MPKDQQRNWLRLITWRTFYSQRDGWFYFVRTSSKVGHWDYIAPPCRGWEDKLLTFRGVPLAVGRCLGNSNVKSRTGMSSQPSIHQFLVYLKSFLFFQQLLYPGDLTLLTQLLYWCQFKIWGQAWQDGVERGALSTGQGLLVPLDVFLCSADTQSSDYYFSRSNLKLLTPFPNSILGIVYLGSVLKAISLYYRNT